MRAPDRHSFKDRGPLLAPWSPPTVTRLDLTKDELGGILASEDPVAELQKVRGRTMRL